MNNILSAKEVNSLKSRLQSINDSLDLLISNHKDTKSSTSLSPNEKDLSLLLELSRLSAEKKRIMEILQNSSVVEIDYSSENDAVEIGDIVSLLISYDDEEPDELTVQIDGQEENVTHITFKSPLSQAILGKTIGSEFESPRECLGQCDFKGIIQGIVKAKDLVNKNDELSLNRSKRD